MAHRRTSSPGSTSHRPEWRARSVRGTSPRGRPRRILGESPFDLQGGIGTPPTASAGTSRGSMEPPCLHRRRTRAHRARVAGRTSRATVPLHMPRRLTPSRAAPLAWTDNYARHARAHGETIRLTIHTVRTTTTFEDKPGRPGAQQRTPAAASHEAISLRPPHRPLTAHRTRAGRPPDRVITCALRESERSGRGGKVVPVRRKAALSAHRVGRWWRSRCVDAYLHECASLPDTATARVTSRFAASHAAGGDAAMVVVDGPMVPSAR